jgi:hypothetical protein
MATNNGASIILTVWVRNKPTPVIARNRVCFNTGGAVVVSCAN